jgi:hypothetical protein
MWGQVRTFMYADSVDKEETLHWIVDACQTIRNYTDIIE